MIKMIEQALSEVFQSSCAPTLSEAEMSRPIQTQSVAKTFDQSLMSNTGFFVTIAEIIGKLMDRAVEEHRFHEIGAASRTTTDNNLFIKHAPPGPKGLRIDPPAPSCTKNLDSAIVTVVSSPAEISTASRYLKYLIRYLTPSLTLFPSVGAVAAVI